MNFQINPKKKIRLCGALLYAVLSLPMLASAQISGTVFRDNNGNGTQDNDATYRERGLGGVTVSAYRSNGSLAATVVSDAASCGAEGAYYLPLTASDYPVRVEFIAPAPYQETFSQTSSIRFFNAAASNVNYGVSDPNAYADVTKGFNVISSVAVRNGYISSSLPIVKSFGYQQGANGGTPLTTTVHANDTYGYLRGVGIDKLHKKVYYAQGNKNFVLNNPAGNNPPTKIFQSDFNNPNATGLVEYIDLAAVGIPINGFTNENKGYRVPDVVNDYNNKINFLWEANWGRVGMGDLDVDEKNEKAYLICMSTQQLVSFPVNKAGSGFGRFSGSDLLAANVLPSATQIARFDIPYPGDGINGGAVPTNNFDAAYIPNHKDDWFVDGLGIYKGKIYIGVTNPRYYARVGQYNGGDYTLYSGSDYTIYYTFDPATGAWARIMDAYMGDQLPGAPLAGCCRNTSFPFVASDIDFDSYNDEMILSYKNLRGDFEVDPNPLVSNPQTGAEYGGNNYFIPQMAYRAFPSTPGASTYNLEYSSGANAGTISRCGSNYAPPTASTATNFGNSNNYYNVYGFQYFPNQLIFHESYYDAYEGPDGHGFIGASATFPGGNQTVFYYADPQNSQTGGINWIPNDANAQNFRQEMWSGNPSQGYFGKGQGTGDIELIYDTAPIEIGNRVFTDTDGDGVQDADEPGLNGVTVELWQGATQVGTITTATLNGQAGSYYFNTANVTMNGATGVLPNTAYEVRVPNISGSSKQAAFGTNALTPVAQGGNGERDSDGIVNGTTAVAAFTTGNVGENTHKFDFGFRTPPPTLTSTINTSGCYDSNGNAAGGTSQVTVQVIVDWTNAISGETITVTVPGATATQSINPATAAKPAILNFAVPTASATSGNVTVVYSTTTTVFATPKAISIAASDCLLTPCTSGTGGQVFRDFNNNGVRDTYETEGVSGVTVTAFYDNAGATGIATTTTDSKGQYTFTTAQVPSGAKVRLEFTGLPMGVSPTASGTNNATATQFITAPLCTANMGVNYPSDYCQNAGVIPRVVVPKYTNGNSQAGGSAATAPALLSYPYDASTSGSSTNIGGANTTGAVWGVAFQRKTNKLFSSAFAKRHVAFGSLGSNGLYVTNNAKTTNVSTATTAFVNLSSINSAFNAGTVTRNFSPGGNDPTQANYDEQMFDKVGKVGMGDLDISDDGQYLYTINLNDRKLWRIDVANGAAPTTAAQIEAYAALPNPCNNSTFRPFAVKHYRGDIYIGGICDGVSGSTVDRNELKATVYKVSASATPSTAVFTQVLDFPLTFNRNANLNGGETNGGASAVYTDPNGNIAGLSNTSWHPWARNFAEVQVINTYSPMYPQPILMDIEFDIDGAMVLGFGDRTGHQGGNQNYSTNTADGATFYTTGAGDILRAYSNNGSFIIETNATEGTTTTAGANNGDGPNGGEFYYQDRFDQGAGGVLGVLSNPSNHDETSLGGLALFPGKGEILNTVFDPRDNYNSGGVRYYSNTTGQANNAQLLYNESDAPGGNFGKAGGMGDVEILCNQSPLEIGNYVWADANANGVQDPTEAGIANIKVQLFNAAGVLVGLTTTNAKGEYYFNQGNVDNAGVNATTGAASGTGFTGLTPITPYYIVVGNGGTNPFAGGTLTVGAATYNITNANTGQGTNPDQNDNDATIATGLTGALGAAINGFPYILATTGSAGETDHSFDFGFTPLGSVGNYVWNDTNSNGTNDEPASAGINGVTVELWKETTPGSGNYAFAQTTLTANNGTGNPGYYNFIITASANYKVKFPTTNNSKILTTPTTTATTDNNSDANTTDGFSPAFAINIGGTGTAKDNPTIDAGYRCNTAATIGGAPTSCVSPNTVLTANLTGGTVSTYAWDDATATATHTVTPTSATAYTVTITATNGCTASTSITLSPPPTIIALSGTASLCEGESTNLSASGGVAYAWSTTESTASINISPIVGTTIYTVTATTASGCTGTATVSILVRAAIVINSVVTTNESLCGTNNGIITINATGAAGALEYRLRTGTTAPYTFIGWQSSNVFPGLSANDYLVYVRYVGGYCTNIDGVQTVTCTLPASLGDRVFSDTNKDGVQDGSEVGVAGVTVTLYNSVGKAVGSTKTDAYGNYLFDKLTPGDYTVGFTLPTNYVFSPKGSGADSGTATDSDADLITGRSNTITLSGGENERNVDAGIYFAEPTTQSIGDYVWFDDGNGVQTAGEKGVSGVTVTLYAADGTTIIATTITDGNGKYLFDNIAVGSYVVGFGTVPGLTFTTQTNGTTDGSDADATTGKTAVINIAAGDKRTDIDAGLVPVLSGKAALGDRVWNDVNNNGVQDAGEAGVPNVTVNLYDATNTIVATTVTNALGEYLFNNLDAGRYKVGFVIATLPSGFVLTTKDVAAANDNTDSDADATTGFTKYYSLAPGEKNLSVDAGIYNATAPTGGIGNYVWNDADKDGIQDANESGIGGITVTLYAADGVTVIATTVTDKTGYYSFNNLPAADYVVGFSNVPTGFVFSNQTNGTGDGSDANPSTGKTNAITVGTTFRDDIDAGLYPAGSASGKGSLGDYVWYDSNNDGIQAATEVGVSGVTVNLLNATTNAIIATTTTDATGHYLFTGLDKGSYKVEFVTASLPSGYGFTAKDAGADDSKDTDVNPATGITDAINLGQGEDKLTVDAGIYKAGAPTGAIGNYVWFDTDGNGTQGAGEKGISGVGVNLLDATTGAIIATTTTDANGFYLFPNLPAGDYKVQFTNLPAGFTFTTQTNGTADGSDADPISGITPTISLAAGQVNLDADAGLISTTRAGLGDYVWLDSNGDGVQDATEQPLAGVTVILYAADGTTKLASTVTDANGYYSFVNLTPGTYVVGFENIPLGATFTKQNATGNTNDSDVDSATGKTAPITLTAGEFNSTIDAGVTLQKAGLGDYVWLDADSNGVQDAGEAGVAGVIVTLYDSATNAVIGKTVTDGNGYYSFTGLNPGTYYVEFDAASLPANATFTTQTTGTANGSDANTVTGRTADVTLIAGEFNSSVDAGIVQNTAALGDYVWIDTDKNGIQDDGEQPLAGVAVNLYLSTDLTTPVATATTDAKGFYWFANLTPASYVVEFAAVAGYTRTGTTGTIGGSAGGETPFFNSDADLTSGRTAVIALAAGERNPNIDAGYYVTPLPVTLLYFKGIADGCSINLNWATASEQNAKSFRVERSADGKTWGSLAVIAAAGNSTTVRNYQFTDGKATRNNYYRLVQTDFDGTTAVYGLAESVATQGCYDETTNGVTNLYPNPNSTNDVTVKFYTDRGDEDATIEIYDVLGHQMSAMKLSISNGTNIVNMDISDLASGTYMVKIVGTGWYSVAQKLVRVTGE